VFDTGKQKVERANYHIGDLEREFQLFVSKKPHRFSVNVEPNTGHMSIRVRFIDKPPSTFALIIGGAIHNLRTALDHLMWEVVGINGGKQHQYLSFPTRDNRVNFESAWNGIETPSQWVKDAVRATEAFDGGSGNDLYQIHDLDRTDKHRTILPTLRATSHPPFRILYPDGRVLATMKGNVMSQGSDEFANIATVPPGFLVELEDDAECPPGIFIVESGGFLGFPMIPTLRRFSHSVIEAIDRIEAAVPI
jgi:hypothetical protein